MSKPLGFLLFAVVVSSCTLALAPAGARSSPQGGGKDKSTGKDTAKKDTAKDTGKPKEKLDPAKVKAQHEKAEQYYKEVFEVDTVPHYESAHFLLYGHGGRALPTVAADLERSYLKATKVLELPKDPGPWPGKLTIYLLPDSQKYPRMVRVAQRRKADEDEFGSIFDDSAFPHVLAATTKAPGNLGIDATASTYMSGYLLQLRAKTKLPDWLTEGFGRATTLYTLGTNYLSADRRKAAAYLTMNSRSIGEVASGNLGADENPPLRASLLDYLAYSGRTSKFLPFIEGFRDDAKGNAGSLNTAFANAKTTDQELSKNWQAYAKALK